MCSTAKRIVNNLHNKIISFSTVFKKNIKFFFGKQFSPNKILHMIVKKESQRIEMHEIIS